MRRNLLPWSLSVVLLAFPAIAFSQLTILSESWESPFRGEHFNGELIAGWRVTGSIDIIGNTHGMIGASHSGAQGIELNGSYPGAVSTNLSTSPYSYYLFTFAYTKNPEIGSARGAVKLDGVTIATLTATQANTYASLNWRLGSLRFRTSSNIHEFRLEGLEGGNAGLYLDTLQIRRERDTLDAYINSNLVTNSEVVVRGSAELSLSAPYPGGVMLYTLDGSEPSTDGDLFTTEFVVDESADVRAVAYSSDFSQSTQLQAFRLTVLPELLVSTDGGGQVTLDPPSGGYLPNSTATITATPDPGWSFIAWIGDIMSSEPVLTVTVSNTMSAVAVFGTSLSNSVIGSGSVNISPAAALYPFSTKVQLTAVPQNSFFVQWGGDATGTNNPYILAVTNAQPVVSALFAALPAGTFSLAVLPVGQGRVQLSPYANRYAAAANVTVTAIPDPYQTFIGWIGDATGTSNPLTVTMTKSKVIQANFSSRPVVHVRSGAGNRSRSDLRLNIDAPLSTILDLEQSSDLATWTPTTRLTNSTGRIELPPYPAADPLQQFYRAHVLAP